MIAGAELARDELGVLLEVDALDRRARGEAGPVEHDELPPLGERVAAPPRSVGRR